MDDIVDNKMQALGASNNFINSKSYHAARSRVFILAANNSSNDTIFLKNLAGAEREFLTFSPADTYSLFVEKFLPIFGNNSSTRALNFYLNLFKRQSYRRTGLSTGVFRNSLRPDTRLYKWSQDPHSFRALRARSARSLRAHSILRRNTARVAPRSFFKYDGVSELFRAPRELPLSGPCRFSKVY